MVNSNPVRSTSATKGLTVRYVTALLMVGVLSTTAFILLSTLLARQESDAPQINVSGRQRMLSQRITAMAMRTVHAPDQSTYEANREILQSAIELMENSHNSLVNGDEEMGISPELEDNLREHYFGDNALDEKVKQFIGKAKTIASMPREELKSDDPNLLFLIEQSQKPLLANLNAAVGLYEENSRNRAKTLHLVETFIWCSTLFLLLVEAVLIFRPMTRFIKKQFDDLAESNSGLVAKERRIQLILDSTRDAFLPVTLEGRIANGASNQVAEIFGEFKEGMPFWDLLTSDPDSAFNFEMGFQQIVDDFLPMEVAVDQAVKQFEFGSRIFGIDYREVMEEGQRSGLLLVIRDITEEVASERAEMEAKERTHVLSHTLKDQSGFRRFVVDTSELIRRMMEEDLDDFTKARMLHTVKGNTAIYGFHRFAALVHETESQIAFGESYSDVLPPVLEAWEDRVDAYREYVYGCEDIRISKSEYERHLEGLIAECCGQPLTAQASRWRFDSVRGRFEGLSASAQSIAERLGKEIQVELSADDDLRLDNSHFGPIWDVLSHMIRNSVDHGIESSEARQQAGKPLAGTLTLGCRVDSGNVEITVEDDGAGINWERIRTRAEEHGLACDTHESLLSALFENGISSRDEVSDLSGRGIGMGAVLECVQNAKGTIDVESTDGKGTRIAISVPLPESIEYQDLHISPLAPVAATATVATPTGVAM